MQDGEGWSWASAARHEKVVDLFPFLCIYLLCLYLEFG